MIDDLHPVAQPYPGLRPFQEDEFEIFFGREAQTNELLKRLARQRFIAVTGPSGCGKSSLVAAGMIPALRSGLMVDAGSRWRICQMRPGSSPMRALAEALSTPAIVGDRHHDVASPDYIEAALRFGPGGLAQVLRESTALAGAAVLLVVDQFEEIFRFRERINPDEADAFVHLLLATARQPDIPVYVVITMRSDYLGDCTVFLGLPEAINDGQYLTPRLNRDECTQAIQGPARVFDGDVHAPLVNALLNDFTTDPDQLPLLQHALMRMWQRKAATSAGQPVLLERTDYTERLGDALDHHAEEVLATLAPDQQRLAQVLFRRLTERAPGRRDTRAPATLGEVAAIAGLAPDHAVEALAPVVEAFRHEGCNFVVASPGTLRPATLLDIGHESLIRQWQRLTGWVDAEADSAAVFLRLSDAARRFNEKKAAKYWGPDLAEALAWRRRERPNQDWANRYRTTAERAAQDTATLARALDFLQTSRRRWVETRLSDRRRKRDERQRRRHGRLAIGFIAVLALVTAATWLWRRADRAEQAMAAELAKKEMLEWEAATERYLTEPWSQRYASFTAVRGMPSGLGPVLTDEQVKRRAMSYKITWKGRGSDAKVVEMEAIDANGRLTTRHGATLFVLETVDTAESRKEVQWQYIYDREGLLAYEVARDSAGRLAGSLVYAPPPSAESALAQRTRQVLGPDGFSTGKSCAAAQVIEFDDRGFEWIERYVDRGGQPVSTPAQDYAPVRARLRDERGFEKEWVSLDTAKRRMNDSVGNSALVSLDHDPFGQPQRIEYRGADGELVEVHGTATQQRAYDDVGNLSEVRLFDRRGRPTTGANGWHRMNISYGAHGLAAEERYWGVDGRPAVQQGYCHALRTRYDDRGRLVEGRCIGTDDKPSPGRIGAPRWQIERDLEGNVTAWSYFGGPGLDRPLVARGGWHRLERVYDQGVLQRERYLDANRRPVMIGRAEASTSAAGDLSELSGAAGQDLRVPGVEQDKTATGYAGIAYAFDADARTEASRTYLDATGRPTMVDLGHAIERRRVDSNGNIRQHAYFGPTGREPARRDSGLVAIDLQREACGRVVRRTFLGPDGQPMWVSGGTAGEAWDYDQLGHLIRRRYLSPTGQPTASSDGIAGWDDGFDRFGQATDRRYVDVDGKPVAKPDGEAGWRKTFDSHGRETRVDYLGLDGRLVATQDSSRGTKYARKTTAYDTMGNAVQESYFDAAGRPITIDGRYATVRQRHDATGTLAEMRYFGLRGEPVLNADGAHRVVYQNNARGHAVAERYFGLQGEAVLIANRFHRVAVEVDLLGRELSRRHFDVASRPVAGSKGWHAQFNHWNARGHLLGARFVAPDGSPALAGEGQGLAYHRWASVSDSHGRVLEWRFFDQSNRPTAGPDGLPIARLTYDALGRKTSVSFFDANDQPATIAAGWSSHQWAYDPQGRLTLNAYFDRSVRPVNPSGGWARTTSRYDARGREVEAAFHAADPEDPTGLRLAGRRVTSHDDDRKTWEEKYIDQHGRMIDTIDGVARAWLELDAGGRVLEEHTFNKQDQPTGRPAHREAVVIKQSYNAQGLLTVRSFYDADDEPVRVRTKVGNCAALRWRQGIEAVRPSNDEKDMSAECLDKPPEPGDR